MNMTLLLLTVLGNWQVHTSADEMTGVQQTVVMQEDNGVRLGCLYSEDEKKPTCSLMTDEQLDVSAYRYFGGVEQSRRVIRVEIKAGDDKLRTEQLNAGASYSFESGDHKTAVFHGKNFKRLMKALEREQEIKVRLPLYPSGSVVATFDTTGFQDATAK